MKLAVLFSGGKDSCLALHLAREKNEICCLLTILPKNFDSFMFHKPYVSLLEAQAEMLGLELITVNSEGKEEKELDDLERLIMKVKGKVDGIVVGGIASSYQGNRIRKICEDKGLQVIAPLWDFSSEDVWKLLLDKKFGVILTKVSCDGLDEKWLGKVIDKEMLGKLRKLAEKYKFRLDFEGGEAESAVLFMPGFEKKIKIKYEIKNEGRYRHFLDIKEVSSN